jgi:hypothetical protein
MVCASHNTQQESTHFIHSHTLQEKMSVSCALTHSSCTVRAYSITCTCSLTLIHTVAIFISSKRVFANCNQVCSLSAVAARLIKTHHYHLVTRQSYGTLASSRQHRNDQMLYGMCKTTTMPYHTSCALHPSSNHVKCFPATHPLAL